MSCIEGVKAELRPSNFLLRYHRKDVFSRSQWGFPPILFILYRLLVAVYMTTWMILSMTLFHSAPPGYSPLHFLTNWGMIILCCHLTLAAVITLLHVREVGRLCSCSVPAGKREENDTPDHVPWYMKFDWFIFNISADAALAITIIFWSFLWPSIARDRVPSVANVHIHAINTVTVFLEFMLSSIPVRLYHFVYAQVFAVMYIVFSVIVWAVDNSKVMYPGILDWNKPSTTLIITISLVLVGIPIVHLFLFGLYKFKVYISHQCSIKTCSDHHGNNQKGADQELPATVINAISVTDTN